jgi:hypothetical protein
MSKSIKMFLGNEEITPFMGSNPVGINPNQVEAWELRADAYSDYVYLAIPGGFFAGQQTDFNQTNAFGDISGDINSSVSNKTIVPTSLGTGANVGKVFLTGSYWSDYGQAIASADAGEVALISGSLLPFSTSNFVVEAYVQPGEVFNRPPFHKPMLRSYEATGNLYLDNSANNPVSSTNHTYRFAYNGSFTNAPNSSCSYTVGTWKHVAFVRSGNTLYYFENGTQKATTKSISGSPTSPTNFSIFGFSFYDNQNENAMWAMQDYRISIGTDRGYVGGFTPPQSIVKKL